MNNRVQFGSIVLFIGCTLASPLHAQKETGAILGVVRDADSQLLAGVTVSATNEKITGRNSVTATGVDGRYRFPALPPGIYEIRAEAEGLQSVVRGDVRLFVGRTVTVDFILELAPLAELLTISEDSPAIDVKTPAVSKTIPAEMLETLPRVTGSWDIIALSPGVGDLSKVAYGAGGSQANGYWFDGVDVSDPSNGSAWQIPNYNWIEEVQVVGLGAPAEYGGFSGVISNSVTRSGGNDFHGLIETFFQNESLTSNNVQSPDLKPPGIHLFSDTTWQLGGPVLRDKLWFFTGLEYYYRSEQPVGYPPNGGEAFRTYREPKFISKMTYRVNQNNTVQGFLEYEDYHWTGIGASPFRLPEATSITDDAGWFWNLGWISILNPETVLDVRTSGFQSPYDVLPQDPDLPGHLDIGTGIQSVNRYYAYRSDRRRNQANVALSHYAQDFLEGNHDFKFGVQYEASSVHENGSYPGGMAYIDFYGTPYYRYVWGGYDLDTNLDRLSTFVQDEWSITDRLNLSLGVRWDHNRVTKDPSIRMNTDPVAPRLGFVFDLMGDQKSIIKAHYGLYYESAITNFVALSGNTEDKIVDCFDAKTGEWELGCDESSTSPSSVAPHIKQQHTRQFTVGLDKQLKGDFTLGVHYIYRAEKDLIENVNVNTDYEPFPFVNPITGETMTLFRNMSPEANKYVFMNPPDAYRKYHGLQITAARRFANGLYLSGSMVFSRAHGNLDNTMGGASGFSKQYNSPNLNINFNGKLTNDVTWEVKIMGSYRLPWNIGSSWYFRHFTGDTWTPRYNLGFQDVNEREIAVFLLPRGSNRLPGRNVLDLRLEKSFGMYRGDLSFIADIFNVFNTGYPLGVADIFNRSNFGEPTHYSNPREVRLGVRYRF